MAWMRRRSTRPPRSCVDTSAVPIPRATEGARSCAVAAVPPSVAGGRAAHVEPGNPPRGARCRPSSVPANLLRVSSSRSRRRDFANAFADQVVELPAAEHCGRPKRGAALGIAAPGTRHRPSSRPAVGSSLADDNSQHPCTDLSSFDLPAARPWKRAPLLN